MAKKLFISQPMKGKSEAQIMLERQAAIDASRKELGDEVEILDSFFNLGENAKPLAYLGESLKVLAEADIAYFAPGWREARGCKIENTCAREYGVAVIEA